MFRQKSYAVFFNFGGFFVFGVTKWAYLWGLIRGGGGGLSIEISQC